MFDDCVGNEPGKFTALHQVRQQESVLGPQRGWIKHAGLDVDQRTPNCESRRVQVSNATVGLKHVVLKGDEPEFFRSPHQVCAIPHEPELKAIMLGRLGDRRTQDGQTVCAESAVSVHE